MLLQFFFHASKDGMDEIRRYVKVGGRKAEFDERDMNVVNIEDGNLKDDSLEIGN